MQILIFLSQTPLLLPLPDDNVTNLSIVQTHVAVAVFTDAATLLSVLPSAVATTVCSSSLLYSLHVLLRFPYQLLKYIS